MNKLTITKSDTCSLRDTF